MPVREVTPEALMEFERDLLAQEAAVTRRLGLVADFEFWTRELLPYSATSVQVLAACPRPGEVTVVVRFRPSTSAARREVSARVLRGYLIERAPVNTLVHVHPVA